MRPWLVTAAGCAALLITALGLYRIATPSRVPLAGTPAPAGPASSGVAAPSPGVASVSGAPSSGSPPGAGASGAPFAFGTLVTAQEHAAEASRRGVKVAMIELSWAAYEPAEGRFNERYGQEFRDRVTELRRLDMQVTLGLGLHFTPAWVLALPDSRFVDQRGRVSAEANIVFSQVLRAKTEKYLARIDRDLGMENLWAIRLTSGGLPEVMYPGGGSYWAFDRNAQNGPDRPAGMSANPAAGWRPGDRSASVAAVRTWADWYVHALVDVVAWQMRVITSLGFRGYFQTLTPGSGTRPDGYERDVASFLPDGVTGVGAVWHRFYAALPVKRNVVAYVSSMADRSGADDSCSPADGAVAVTDRAANRWSASRWVARLAREHGLAVSGENPGWNQPAEHNAHYTDTSSKGMMAASIRQMTTCKFQGMYWAHDENLWKGPASFDRYAQHIAATNGPNSPTPPMP
jgi:hypothetical protein